ncbi:MAG: ATP-binding protein [bacterium]|nr:ATP-binding protein [bacterium]
MIKVIFLIGSWLLLVITMVGVIQLGRKIRTKMVICFFLISLMPVIPLVFVLNGIMERSLKIGINKEIIASLEGAKVLEEEVLNHEKEAVLQRAIYLSQNPHLIPKSKDIEIFEGDVKESLVKAALSQQKPFAFVCGKNDEIIKGVAPIFEEGKIKKVVVVRSTLSQDFIQRTQDIKDSLKFYSSVNLLRAFILEGYLLIFAVVALLMVSIAFLTGYVISKRLTRPLKSLIKGFEEVGLGNLNYQVKAETKDEMAKTIKSFNLMVKELKESRELLLEAEREAAWRGIAQRIAHEIKGPLTPIQLSLQHLQDKFKEDPKEYENVLTDCTRRITQEIDTLRKMAKEFSEFARMPEPAFEYTDVNKILEDTVNLFAQVSPEVKINATYGVNLPRIRLDRERMKIVFKNIIQNGIDALEVSHEGGEINIETSCDKQFLKIKFQDTGSGMDEETIKKIFTPYFSTKSYGMGIGLPIVDRIIKEHKAKIEVESQPDKGTTFVILLPVKGSE